MQRIYVAKASHLVVSVGMRVVLLVVVLGALAFVSRPGLGAAIQNLDASPSPEGTSGTPTLSATAVLTGTSAAGLSPRAIVLAAINGMPARYRFEYSWTYGQTDQAGSREASPITIAGEVDGKSEHWVMNGTVLADAGIDPDTGVESVIGGGKAYVKGAPLWGMDPKLWYMMDPADPTVVFLLNTLRSRLALGEDEDYARMGSEVLDTQPCELYRYNMPLKGAEPLMVQLSPSSERRTYTAIDKAEYVFWVCQDGYLHKYRFEQEGHDPQDATSQGRAVEEYHFWDMNSSTIAIATPSEAKPMPTLLPAATATPQPTRTPAPTWAAGQPTPTPHPTPVSNWLLAEDFADNRNDWPIEAAPSGRSYFQDSAYYVGVTEGGSFLVACSRCGFWRDFVYEAMLQKVEGADDSEYGLVFRNLDKDMYFLPINGSGSWMLERLTPNGWQTIKGWAPADAINKGNAKNKLRVVSSGPDLNFFINDRWVGQASDETIQSSHIGVGVSGKGALIRVESVRVWSVGQ